MVVKATYFAKLAVGWGTATATSFIIDEVMWTPMVMWLGPVKGGLVMTVVALVCNLLLIWAYDTLKQDFLSFEAMREIETEQNPKGFWKRILSKALRTGKIPAFIALSFYDPFLAVIFSRESANAYKMTKRDWMNFGLAMLIACVGWTSICSIAGWLIKFSWKSLAG